MLYMVTFTINIPPMLAYIPYMDSMGNGAQVPRKPFQRFWSSIWTAARNVGNLRRWERAAIRMVYTWFMCVHYTHTLCIILCIIIYYVL